MSEMDFVTLNHSVHEILFYRETSITEWTLMSVPIRRSDVRLLLR